MRIYVACLASYNNGVLHGRWIDAQSDADAMQEEVSAMLRESKFPNVTVACPECEGTGYASSYKPGQLCHKCKTCKSEGKVPSAEEFAIHDFDGLPSSMGEHCGLQAVADYVEFIEELTSDHCLTEDHAQDLAKAMLDNWHDLEQARSDIENYCGTHDTFRDYSDEAADEMLACHENLPDIVSRYFDYDAWERDLAIEMTALELPNGVAVFHA